jgi:hypothetical protein
MKKQSCLSGWPAAGLGNTRALASRRLPTLRAAPEPQAPFSGLHWPNSRSSIRTLLSTHPELFCWKSSDTLLHWSKALWKMAPWSW